jgi:hypothetical protein
MCFSTWVPPKYVLFPPILAGKVAWLDYVRYNLFVNSDKMLGVPHIFKQAYKVLQAKKGYKTQG